MYKKISEDSPSPVDEELDLRDLWWQGEETTRNPVNGTGSHEILSSGHAAAILEILAK